MTMPGVNIPGQTSVRDALRRASDALHQRMHGLEPFAQIAAGTLPIARYRRLLQALFRFHAIVGAHAQRAGWSQLSAAGCRLALLRRDLEFLGGAIPAPVSDRGAGPGEAALGALYVAEGSVFGGHVIARQLDYAFGTALDGRRFFNGDRPARGNWGDLIAVIEAHCNAPAAREAAIAGALSTFDLFERCLVGVSPRIARGRRAAPALFNPAAIR